MVKWNMGWPPYSLFLYFHEYQLISTIHPPELIEECSKPFVIAFILVSRDSSHIDVDKPQYINLKSSTNRGFEHDIPVVFSYYTHRILIWPLYPPDVWRFMAFHPNNNHWNQWNPCIFHDWPIHPFNSHSIQFHPSYKFRKTIIFHHVSLISDKTL